MLPVLTRLNGQPVVSPEGQIVYHRVADYGIPAASSAGATVPASEDVLVRLVQGKFYSVLDCADFVGALVLGICWQMALPPSWVDLSPLCKEFTGCYWLWYGFFGVPLVRYFWIQWRKA